MSSISGTTGTIITTFSTSTATLVRPDQDAVQLCNATAKSITVMFFGAGSHQLSICKGRCQAL